MGGFVNFLQFFLIANGGSGGSEAESCEAEVPEDAPVSRMNIISLKKFVKIVLSNISEKLATLENDSVSFESDEFLPRKCDVKS